MANAPLGKFTFVLHSHIPYVLAHGRWPHGMDWLVEVAAETYVPLLDVLHRLVAEGISPRITLGLTPVLTEQLADDTFKDEFIDYLQQKIDAAKLNQSQFKAEGNMHLLGLAMYWEDFYRRVFLAFTETYQCSLVAAFRALQDAGHIEIITSAATHGYLPLLLTDESVQAQVKTGIRSYERNFGRSPKGFWLPECAYRPRYAWNPPVAEFRTATPHVRKGVEEFLAENGIEYFFVDAHLLRGGEAIGVYADRFRGLQDLWQQFSKGYVPETDERTPYQPYIVNSTGAPLPLVAAFSRDSKTGAQVWSGEHGYPGDPAYLEFHKKHYPGNLRYWRVSDDKADLGAKRMYEPFEAQNRTRDHAKHFAALVRSVLTEYRSEHGGSGFVTALYDTELFGHWWFEGPEFLYHTIREFHAAGDIDLNTCGAYLDATEPQTVVSLPEGSWGEGGYHWIWLNEWTAWTWEKIYEAETSMKQLATEFGEFAELAGMLKQAARELLLLESSDWQFSISTYGSRDYAEERVKFHHRRFTQIADLIRRTAAHQEISHEEWGALGESEDRDRCFPDLDPRWWAALEHPIPPDDSGA